MSGIPRDYNPHGSTASGNVHMGSTTAREHSSLPRSGLTQYPQVIRGGGARESSRPIPSEDALQDAVNRLMLGIEFESIHPDDPFDHPNYKKHQAALFADIELVCQAALGAVTPEDARYLTEHFQLAAFYPELHLKLERIAARSRAPAPSPPEKK